MKIKIYLLISCLLVFSFQQGTQEESSFSLMTILATAEVEYQPDSAEIEFEIRVRGKTTQETTDLNTAAVNRLIDLLASQGVERTEIEASFVGLIPSYDDEDGFSSNNLGTTPEYYDGVTYLIFLLTNLTNYENILVSLFQNGINYGATVTFGAQNQTQFEAQAREIAISSAKEKAIEVASDFGVTLGEVSSIRKANLTASSSSALSRSQATQGSKTISYSVSVDFIIYN